MREAPPAAILPKTAATPSRLQRKFHSTGRCGYTRKCNPRRSAERAMLPREVSRAWGGRLIMTFETLYFLMMHLILANAAATYIRLAVEDVRSWKELGRRQSVKLLQIDCERQGGGARDLRVLHPSEGGVVVHELTSAEIIGHGHHVDAAISADIAYICGLESKERVSLLLSVITPYLRGGAIVIIDRLFRVSMPSLVYDLGYIPYALQQSGRSVPWRSSRQRATHSWRRSRHN